MDAATIDKLEAIAADWIESVDPVSKRIYYGNIKTSETTWSVPEDVAKWKQAVVNEEYWQGFDKVSKRPFYVNKRSKKSLWSKPNGKISIQSSEEPTKDENKAAAEERLPAGWVACIDPKSKRTYYANAELKKTQWAKPVVESTTSALKVESKKEDDKWITAVDPKTKRTYYINTKTFQTSWTLPSSEPKSTSHDSSQHDKEEASVSETAKPTSKVLKIEPSETKSTEESVSKPVQKVAFAAKPSKAPKPADDDTPKSAKITKMNSQTLDKISTTPAAEMCNDGTIKGWIYKRGLYVSNYKYRYFILTGQVLSYYKSDKTLHRKGHIDMTKVESVCLSTDDAAANNAFVIEVKTAERIWYLAVGSIEDMQLWLESLQLSIKLGKTHPRAAAESLNTSSLISSPTINGATSNQEAASEDFVDNVFTSVHSGTAEEIIANFNQNRIRINSQESEVDSVDSGAPNGKKMSLAGYSSQPGRVNFKRASRRVSRNLSIASLPSTGPAAAEAHLSFEEWIRSANLAEFKPLFVEHGYDDLMLIAQLLDSDLKHILESELAIEKAGHRMKIVLAVRQLRKKLNLATIP